MNQPSEDIKRWTARRKAAAIMEIIKGKTTAAEIARSHELTVAEIDQWMDDFVSQGTEALRSHPRDAEAIHKAEKKELLGTLPLLSIAAGAMVGVSLCPSLAAAPVRSSAMHSSGLAEPKLPNAPWKRRCWRALAHCAALLPTCCFVMTMAWSSVRANTVPWSATTDSNRNTPPHTTRSKTACASVS